MPWNQEVLCQIGADRRTQLAVNSINASCGGSRSLLQVCPMTVPTSSRSEERFISTDAHREDLGNFIGSHPRCCVEHYFAVWYRRYRPRTIAFEVGDIDFSISLDLRLLISFKSGIDLCVRSGDLISRICSYVCAPSPCPEVGGLFAAGSKRPESFFPGRMRSTV